MTTTTTTKTTTTSVAKPLHLHKRLSPALPRGGFACPFVRSNPIEQHLILCTKHFPYDQRNFNALAVSQYKCTVGWKITGNEMYTVCSLYTQMWKVHNLV